MSELAIVSARRARLQQLADEGSSGARVALELTDSPNRLLSTVQIGITLVGIFAGAFGGARLTTYLSDALSNVALLDRYSEPLGFAIIVLSITYLSLVIGELVPKRIALHNPERVASMVARPMSALAVAARPIVAVLSFSTEAVLRVLGMRDPVESPVTEEEIKILVEQGTAAGVFAPGEQELVSSVFRLADRHAADLATPRTQVVWVDLEDPPEASREVMARSSHHYFPVSEGDLDRVVGVLSVKDLWRRERAGGAVDIRSVMQPPLFVPENLPALQVLDRFRETKVPLALVIDEYGGVLGVCTINDVLRSLVGQYVSTEGSPDALIRQREDGSWILDGMLPIDEFEDWLRVDVPDTDEGDYQTIGGFVMARLGTIPSEADEFEWSGLHFEVLDMDGHRVDKVLVSRIGLDEE